MNKKDVPETKLKILKAAEKLFAEKGFDGSRVDDIAENAGVNKALIYYYFKSKRDVLDELFNRLIEDFTEITYDIIEEGIDFASGGDLTQQMEGIMGFMEERRDTFIIMMMESLKASDERPPLFRYSEISMSDESERIKQMMRDKGFNVDALDMDEALIADFFTGLMPLISFIVYRDKWSEYFHIDPEELKEKFFSIFFITHIAFHKLQLARLLPAGD